jgi:hypothetical protein
MDGKWPEPGQDINTVLVLFLLLLLQVLAEVAQMRSGWSQAKAIIKQQRRTIKQQELQLQLALNGALSGVSGLGSEHLLLQQQQQLDDKFAAGMAAAGGAAAADRLAAGARGNGGGGGSFPITSFVLQRQQLQPEQQQQHRPGRSAGGSLGWVAVHSVSLGGNDDGRTAVQNSKCSSREAGQGLGAFGLQQGQIQDQVPAGTTMQHAGIAAAAAQGVVDQQQQQPHEEELAAAKSAAAGSLWQAQHAQQLFRGAAAGDSGKAASSAAELLGCTNEILRNLRGQ